MWLTIDMAAPATVSEIHFDSPAAFAGQGGPGGPRPPGAGGPGAAPAGAPGAPAPGAPPAGAPGTAAPGAAPAAGAAAGGPTRWRRRPRSGPAVLPSASRRIRAPTRSTCRSTASRGACRWRAARALPGSTTIVLEQPVRARYIRITQTGTEDAPAWSVARLQVYGPPAPASPASKPSAARPRPAGTAAPGASAGRGAAAAAGPAGAPPAGAARAAGAHDGFPVGVSTHPRAYDVHVSLDGQSWGPPAATGKGMPGSTTIVLDQPVRARYIRITQTGTEDALAVERRPPAGLRPAGAGGRGVEAERPLAFPHTYLEADRTGNRSGRSPVSVLREQVDGPSISERRARPSSSRRRPAPRRGRRPRRPRSRARRECAEVLSPSYGADDANTAATLSAPRSAPNRTARGSRTRAIVQAAHARDLALLAAPRRTPQATLPGRTREVCDERHETARPR